jgi:hypothetical protein
MLPAPANVQRLERLLQGKVTEEQRVRVVTFVLQMVGDPECLSGLGQPVVNDAWHVDFGRSHTVLRVTGPPAMAADSESWLSRRHSTANGEITSGVITGYEDEATCKSFLQVRQDGRRR